MTLKTQIEDDLDIFLNTDEFAETISYNGSSISAIFSSKKNLDNDTEVKGGDTSMAKAILIVKVSDIASPAYRDTVIRSNVTWKIRDIEFGDGYIWKLNIYRDERPVL